MSRLCRKWDVVISAALVCLIVENETTLSFYNHAAYEEFKANPEEKWI